MRFLLAFKRAPNCPASSQLLEIRYLFDLLQTGNQIFDQFESLEPGHIVVMASLCVFLRQNICQMPAVFFNLLQLCHAGYHLHLLHPDFEFFDDLGLSLFVLVLAGFKADDIEPELLDIFEVIHDFNQEQLCVLLMIAQNGLFLVHDPIHFHLVHAQLFAILKHHGFNIISALTLNEVGQLQLTHNLLHILASFIQELVLISLTKIILLHPGQHIFKLLIMILFFLNPVVSELDLFN